MKTIQRAVGSAFVVGLLGLLPGCAAAPKVEAPNAEVAPAPGTPALTAAPAEEAEAEPTTLADAEARLERARADLDRLASNGAFAAPGAAGTAGPPPASVQVVPAPAPAPARDDARRAEKSSSSSADAAAPAPEVNPCQTACKAFSSLTRASDAVCRLDSGDGKRCERARQIREDASRRVASCSCSK